jgi:hypothetical protein
MVNLAAWGSMSGVTANSTKGSGWMAKDMALALGKEQITPVMWDSGIKENLKVSGCWSGPKAIDTKDISKTISNTGRATNAMLQVTSTEAISKAERSKATVSIFGRTAATTKEHSLMVYVMATEFGTAKQVIHTKGSTGPGRRKVMGYINGMTALFTRVISRKTCAKATER